MRLAGKAIEKWHRRAVFIDLHKTRIIIEDDMAEDHKEKIVPEDLSLKVMKSLSKIKDHRRSSFRSSLSMIELILTVSSVICFVIFVYFAGLSFQMSGMAVKSQLEVMATLSLIVGIVVFVSLITSVAIKRLFSKDMQ